ncbi:MAG TPA: [FeFe] hydrogenase H-cluster radical SAM maturase HydG [Deltaproteobacteria bacterium]|nr:[FeFe] hydrogenase H-cluster radical SAM maturase HydG [Deltaproteobacteria bacterium]
MKDFINDQAIIDLLDRSLNPHDARVREIIAKSRELKGLDPEEAAVLLQVRDPELNGLIFEAAHDIKNAIYGNRLVMFAPLYTSNRCSNNCLYCGFRRDNRELKRVSLTLDEIAEEVRILERQGHKRLLMLCGEQKGGRTLDRFIEAIETAYATTTEGGGEIRRINVEVAPQDVEGFRRLKAANIGTYVLFQETYHHATYKAMHPSGPKADYLWRLSAMDRAMEAGIDDVGIGALFGLCDYRFDVLGLLHHARYLDEKFGVGPHTMSVPRLEPALNAPAAIRPPNPVSDYDFKRIVAIIRMSVPYTGIILSTRERPEVRREIFKVGISQISAGSRTNPGGYHNGVEGMDDAAQFNLGDTRSLDEVILDISKEGHIPSFCTACYRLGRTGSDFMDLAKPGLIQKFCRTNAIMTYLEYLVDYASPETRRVGEELIGRLVSETGDNGTRRLLEERLEKIRKGERDLYI